MSPTTIAVRPRTLRRRIAAVLALACLAGVGAAAVCAPEAQATTPALQAMICENLGDYPSADGVVGTAAGLVLLLGVSAEDAAGMVVESVVVSCPEYTYLLAGVAGVAA